MIFSATRRLLYWGLLYAATSKVSFRFISGGTVAIPESQEVEKTLFTGVSTLFIE